jgi:predicted amidohydrolase
MRLEHVAPDMARWAAAVEAVMAEAAGRGAEVLVMPEWAAKQWLAFAPPDLSCRREIPWLAGQAPEALDLLKPLAERHGVALLPGTTAVHSENLSPPWVNRAHLLLPDGSVLHHDKLCLTPSERDPDDWHLSTGSRVDVFDLNGVRTAMLICLDIELPALSARLASAGIDLLLVPSYTSRLSGYSRVFSCARARAVELLCGVCVVGCFGKFRTANASEFQSTGGAAVYVPCEPELGMTGVLDEIPARDQGEGRGPLLVADVPVGKIRALREQATGEVWPGAWDASRVTLG